MHDPTAKLLGPGPVAPKPRSRDPSLLNPDLVDKLGAAALLGLSGRPSSVG
jgi:hypothetical protein